MEKAMNALAMDENLYVRRAALQFNVLKSTLGDRMSGSVIPGAKSGPPKLLTTSEETELVEFLIRSGAVGYARSRKEVLSLVLDIVQRKGKPVTSISNGWWESFRRRHPSLVLRGAAPLSFQYSCSSLRSWGNFSLLWPAWTNTHCQWLNWKAMQVRYIIWMKVACHLTLSHQKLSLRGDVQHVPWDQAISLRLQLSGV